MLIAAFITGLGFLIEAIISFKDSAVGSTKADCSAFDFNIAGFVYFKDSN